MTACSAFDGLSRYDTISSSLPSCLYAYLPALRPFSKENHWVIRRSSKADLLLLSQCSLAHQLLPKDQQTKPEEDYAYLSPIIKEIESEGRERDDLDTMVVARKKEPQQAEKVG